MPRNIEIKARVASLAELAELATRVAAVATEGPIEIAQDDTFFRCANGRLKLRDFANGSGELIFYRRADESGPKESFYLRSPTDAPAALRDTLTAACGAVGRVRKRRTLYLVGRTRVHLDHVEGLGPFVELEVVLRDDEAADIGVAEADALMRRLGIAPAQLVHTAYVDLLTTVTTDQEPA